MPVSNADRRELARIAANERWARERDRTAATSAARAAGPGSIEYWLKRVDPDGVMSDADRLKAAGNAKAAFYARLTRAGRQARAAKRAS
ncbi:hypothetical protein [Herbidospora daliensis]|uniref:hypothetical protein n=1 Tax=Herbidospora daliensis TaxID=295585 RepID=UPI0007847693|nr:hypothetical protein [Herbidospora daliensis]